MKIAILGSAGMIGQEFLAQVSAAEALMPDVTALIACDVVKTPTPATLAERTTDVVGNVTDAAVIKAVLDHRPDCIIHLASVVSGEAETDFDKGYQVNFDATYALLETIRGLSAAEGYRPRFIFASSIAVFGPPFTEVLEDNFHLAPRTSYGTQKAMQELLVNDYTRRGFIDGISLRLPTICVRPGKPNLAASSFFSNIIREPLAGKEAILPVDESLRHWFASPQAAAGFFIHALTVDLSQMDHNRALSMPGVSATVGEQIEALAQVGGSEAVALIRKQIDPVIEGIVSGWAPNFTAARARALGFEADWDFMAIVEKHQSRFGG
ncbi:MAG: NAD-dependent epimerase [Geminicoccus sp.]|nr:NAD-dependent epimerase [Geminicoccus sp.]